MKAEKIQKTKDLIYKLESDHKLSKPEWLFVLENASLCEDFILEKACAIRDNIYGKNVFVRGLIEFTNYCKNDCFYCGIRCSNKNALRYRLTEDDIMLCCKEGYELGFRTFVLQGGEDFSYSDEQMCHIISNIKKTYPECAVTLSIGERKKVPISVFLRRRRPIFAPSRNSNRRAL